MATLLSCAASRRATASGVSLVAVLPVIVGSLNLLRPTETAPVADRPTETEPEPVPPDLRPAALAHVPAPAAVLIAATELARRQAAPAGGTLFAVKRVEVSGDVCPRRQPISHHVPVAGSPPAQKLDRHARMCTEKSGRLGGRFRLGCTNWCIQAAADEHHGHGRQRRCGCRQGSCSRLHSHS